MNDSHHLAASVNRHCLCQTLNKSLLEKEISRQLGDDLLLKNNPNLFSQTSVYISKFTLKELEDLIRHIENVIQSQSFQNEVLNSAPEVALKDFGPHGVFMGYDFHLAESGPKLIEINTNAGGGLLNLYLAQAQVACCEGVQVPFRLDDIEVVFFEMFMNEWRLQRGEEKLKTVVIVDNSPQTQYLYPEFQLFSNLFKKYGLECFILDPEALNKKDDGLWFGDKKIDLIYNRLTDFYFDESRHQSLKQAYLDQQVVITPNPHHHALYANKFNLELLCRFPELESGIPHTVRVTSENKDSLWDRRREYFFKPANGYGSKATYRGDKMTLKVWNEIKELNYVAQKVIRPGERIVQVEDGHNYLKLDIRVYTYQGKIQLLAARLYSGQTTNFRTAGGGFAPVFLI